MKVSRLLGLVVIYLVLTTTHQETDQNMKVIDDCYKDIRVAMKTAALIDTESFSKLPIDKSRTQLRFLVINSTSSKCSQVQRPKLIEFCMKYLVEKLWTKCVKYGYDFIVTAKDFYEKSNNLVTRTIELLNLVDKVKVACKDYI